MPYPAQPYSQLLTQIDTNEAEVSSLPQFVYGQVNEWFDRQENCLTGQTGKKRVSVIHCGDSLAERLCGWISYYGERDFPDNIGKGLDTTTNPFSQPTTFFPLTGHRGTPVGDAARLDGNFNVWPSGIYYDLGPSSSMLFPPQKVSGSIFVADTRPFDTVKAFYVAESGGPTFAIDTSPDGTTWTQQGANILAANATQIGAFATRTVTAGSYHVRIRHVSGTGRLKLIGIYTGWPSGTGGFEGAAISQGGITPSQFCTTPSAITAPIISEIDPGLITFHFADTPTEWTDHFNDLITFARAGNANRSVLFVASHSYSTSGADEETIEIRNFLRSKVESDRIALLDLRAIAGTYSQIDTGNWEGDGVHLDVNLYSYGYSVLEQSLPIRALAKVNDPYVSRAVLADTASALDPNAALTNNGTPSFNGLNITANTSVLGFVDGNNYIRGNTYFYPANNPFQWGGIESGGLFLQVLETRNGATATKICVDGSYTNSSNYIRGELRASTSAVTIAVDRAGTFATNNVDVIVQPAGSGKLIVNGASTTGTFVANILTGLTTFSNNGLKIESSGVNLFNELRASGGSAQFGINGEEMFFETLSTLSSGMAFYAASIVCLRLTNVQNVLAGLPTRPTNATSGFLYIPTCAGLPTGTPTSVTGMAPMVIDSTNNRLYFYSGGAWRLAGV